MRNKEKYLVEFEATKKLIVPAANPQEAMEKAAKRVGRFWNIANARPIFGEKQNG